MKGPCDSEVSEVNRFEPKEELLAAIFETGHFVEAVYPLQFVLVAYVLEGSVEVLSDGCLVAEAVEQAVSFGKALFLGLI